MEKYRNHLVLPRTIALNYLRQLLTLEMASPGGFSLQDSHSCRICEQIIVDLGNPSPQKHESMGLETGAGPDEAGNCELLRQFSRIREGSPDAPVQLQIARSRRPTAPISAWISDARGEPDTDDIDRRYFYHVYATEGIPLHAGGRLIISANQAHSQTTWPSGMCHIAFREWMYHPTEFSKWHDNGCGLACTAISDARHRGKPRCRRG